MLRQVTLAVAAGLAAGCASAPKPARVIGAGADLAQLEGEWVGEYYSRTTGREGSIVLALSANQETAQGQAWLLARPPHALPPYQEPDVSTVQPIAIQFIRTSGDLIRGTLAAYPDPVTGYPLMTTLYGCLMGDRMSGTFVSDNAVTGDWTAGSWSAQRRTAGWKGGPTGLPHHGPAPHGEPIYGGRLASEGSC